jgi:geranylgeranyl pyrophosphate synthase
MDTPSIREFVDLPEVWDRMGEIEDRLLEVSSSGDSFLTEVAQHLITAGGKRFRPLLAMLAAQLGDPSGANPSTPPSRWNSSTSEVSITTT